MEEKTFSPYEPPKADIATEEEVKGLGGWLILVGLGVVISPLRMVADVYSVYSGVFLEGLLEKFTTPGSEFYSPLFIYFLIGEMAINGALILAWIFIAFLFFSKKKSFPKWYVGILVFVPAFIFIDALVMGGVLPGVSGLDDETLKELLRSLAAALIWIPYMRISKRVKATFVN